MFVAASGHCLLQLLRKPPAPAPCSGLADAGKPVEALGLSERLGQLGRTARGLLETGLQGPGGRSTGGAGKVCGAALRCAALGALRPGSALPGLAWPGGPYACMHAAPPSSTCSAFGSSLRLGLKWGSLVEFGAALCSPGATCPQNPSHFLPGSRPFSGSAATCASRHILLFIWKDRPFGRNSRLCAS